MEPLEGCTSGHYARIAALLLAPEQIMRHHRMRHLRFHRSAGRACVAACVIGGCAGLATALHAAGGPVAGLGCGTLEALWVGTTLWGWWAAVVRRATSPCTGS